MDGRSFDALARKLSSTTSRRTALKALFGGAVVTVAGAALVGTDAEAACRLGGSQCIRNGDCCSSACYGIVYDRRGRVIKYGACAAGPSPTPTCAPNGTSCTSWTQCCSGTCDNAYCVA